MGASGDNLGREVKKEGSFAGLRRWLGVAAKMGIVVFGDKEKRLSCSTEKRREELLFLSLLSTLKGLRPLCFFLTRVFVICKGEIHNVKCVIYLIDFFFWVFF